MKKALINGHVFDGKKFHSGLAVIVEDKRISAVLPEKAVLGSVEDAWDLDGHILAPGLIDIQVNGGGGVMFNDAPTVESIRTIGEAHRRFGTTGFLPTLISTDFDTMDRACVAVEQAIIQGVPGVLGIHLEGPFLNPDKCGIHDADRFCRLDEAAFSRLTSFKSGRMLVTIAPELCDGEMISRLCNEGVIVFGGHSAASYRQTRKALKSGLRGFTHLFNAMSGLESREPGMVGAALENRHSWCGMIADGQHLHPAVFAVAVSAKRKGHTLLVTDAMASVGSDTKQFVFDGVELTAEDGCCRTAKGQLAGSDLDMISAVRNAASFAGLNPSAALRMGSSYPAHALGLEDQLGYIRPGFRASFIEVDDKLNLYRTWIDGEVSA